MKKSTVLKNLLMSFDYLDKAFVELDPNIPEDDEMMDNEVDVDLVATIMMMRDIIKKIDAKEYKRIMKEAAIGG